MYFDSEHYQKVEEASRTTSLLKTQKALYVNRVDQKNYHIMRHVFERLRDSCGVYDGLRGAKNYAKGGIPRKLKAGFPGSPYCVHMIAWQKELIKGGLLSFEEVLAPASVLMHIRWAITMQKFSPTFRLEQAAFARRAAVNAYWLLTADLIKIEDANFSVTNDKAVTLELD